MTVEKGINEQEALKRFYKFMKKYGHLYQDHERDFINEHFLEFLYSPSCADILMQLYGELGIEPKIGTFYNAHLSRIQELYGLDKNILEVGGGRLPTFANKVAAYQHKLKKGTITMYDPLLIKTKPAFKNLTLCKEEFTIDHDIHSYDLVTGLLPCEATEAIIVSACRAHKDFYVAMCGCSHFQYYDPFGYCSPHMYQNYVVQLAEDLINEHEMGELVVDFLPDEYEIEYPILYNRKK